MIEPRCPRSLILLIPFYLGGQSRQHMGKGKRKGKGCWKTQTENTMECYSPETNQWTRCAAMKMRRYFPNVAALDGKIYVLGGQDDGK